MITNEKQYRMTRSALAKFEKVVEQLRAEPIADMHPRLQKAHINAAQSEIEVLQEQLAEYDALKSGRVELPELSLIEEVPRALIRARIASGMTQEQLAQALQLKTQQIQRYEASEYAGASLSRVREIAHVLIGKKRNPVSA